MTIKLTNGFIAEIPNHQLIHPARVISDKGEVAIGNDTVKVLRINKLEGTQGNDLPILGAPFLSQTYFVVDHDNHVMKFANAKPSSEQDLQPMISENNSTVCAKTTETSTNKPSESGVTNQDQTGSTQEPEKTPKLGLPIVIGIVVGSIAFLSFLGSIVFLAKWNRRRQQKHLNQTPHEMGSDASASQLNHNSIFQSQALPGPDSQQIYPNSVSHAPSQSTAELDSQGYYEIQDSEHTELDGIPPQRSLAGGKSNSPRR